MNDDRKKPVIGLVGGIGSGKSLVARQLASLGAGVIDADELAKRALDEPEVKARLVQMWGTEVLREDGGVDRSRVGGLVFDDPVNLRKLEALIHPRVNLERKRLRSAFTEDPGVVAIVEDCPLLLESGIWEGCDAVIYVDAERSRRLDRVKGTRGWSGQELNRREKLQMGLDIKAERADYVIDNNAGEEECLHQVRRVFSQILDIHA